MVLLTSFRIRQSGLCHAGLSIRAFEWQEPNRTSRSIDFSPHICKKRDAVYKFVEETHASPFGDALVNPWTGMHIHTAFLVCRFQSPLTRNLGDFPFPVEGN